MLLSSLDMGEMGAPLKFWKHEAEVTTTKKAAAIRTRRSFFSLSSDLFSMSTVAVDGLIWLIVVRSCINHRCPVSAGFLSLLSSVGRVLVYLEIRIDLDVPACGDMLAFGALNPPKNPKTDLSKYPVGDRDLRNQISE
jgi:hypothetical protein